jgi:hypothetical protein
MAQEHEGQQGLFSPRRTGGRIGWALAIESGWYQVTLAEAIVDRTF